MKIIQQGFEPEVSVQTMSEPQRVAPRKSRIRLQPIMTDSRLFHAYTA